MPNVQSITPDDGQRKFRKHIKNCMYNNKFGNECVCWFNLKEICYDARSYGRKKQATRSSDTLVLIHQTTRRLNRKQSTLSTYRCDNLIFHTKNEQHDRRIHPTTSGCKICSIYGTQTKHDNTGLFISPRNILKIRNK